MKNIFFPQRFPYPVHHSGRQLLFSIFWNGLQIIGLVADMTSERPDAHSFKPIVGLAEFNHLKRTTFAILCAGMLACLACLLCCFAQGRPRAATTVQALPYLKDSSSDDDDDIQTKNVIDTPYMSITVSPSTLLETLCPRCFFPPPLPFHEAGSSVSTLSSLVLIITRLAPTTPSTTPILTLSPKRA